MLLVYCAEFAVTGDVPMVALPSLKVTVPVGCPPYWDEMAAVKVTACPTPEGFTLELRVKLVLA